MRAFHSVTSILTALSAATLLSACSATDSPVGPDPVETGPSETSLVLDFSYIRAIKDCDGVEGDGDFSFTVRTTVSSGGGGQVYSASATLGDGDQTAAIGRRTYTVPATNGQAVTVELVATEHDKSIFGVSYDDARMSGLRRTLQHTFNNGWSNTGPQSIDVGSGDCQVRLVYSANPG